MPTKVEAFCVHAQEGPQEDSHESAHEIWQCSRKCTRKCALSIFHMSCFHMLCSLPNFRNCPVAPTPSTFSKVLRYKWEAYCNTNGRSTDSVSLSSERRGTGSTAIQIGGVLQYKLEVYCNTFSRSSGGWGFWHYSECLSSRRHNSGDAGRTRTTGPARYRNLVTQHCDPPIAL